jgi:hypothetical protein
MSFKRTVPSSPTELKTYLDKIHKNQSHVKKVEVNLTTGHIEVSLDGAAHFAGNSDVFLPIKRGKLNEAKLLMERMMTQSHSGFPPSEADANALFDMIDQQGN